VTAFAERMRPGATLNIVVLGAAVTLGAVAAVKPAAAVALAFLGLGVATLVMLPWLFVPLMIASVYFGAITLGGFAAARIVGPIALPVALVAAVRQGGFGVRGTNLVYWIAAYCTLAFASLLWTEDQGGTVGLLFSLALAVIYTVAITALTRTRAHLRNAMAAFVVAGIALFAVFMFALAQYGDPIQAQADIGDRNFFAAFLSVSLAVAIALIRWPQANWERKLGIAGVVICGAGIVASQSQGGMLAMLTIAIVGAVLIPRPAARRRFALGYAAAVPLIVAGVIIVLGSGGYQSQAAGSGLTSSIETSAVDRLNLWRGAMNAYSHNPVTGIGFGAYANHSSEWMIETPGVNLRLYNLPDHPQEAHNSYIEALSELGPLGLVLFVGMIASCAWTLGRMLRAARLRGDSELEAFTVGMLLAISGFSVASFFLSIITNRMWWVIFGLTIAAARIAYDERLARANSSGSERNAVTGGEIFNA